MAEVAAPAEDRIRLYGQTWEMYEWFVAKHDGNPSMRVTFDDGYLEILVASARHEQPNQAISKLIQTIADELRLNYVAMGAPTFQRKDLQKGFEPDSCYYFRNLKQVRSRDFNPSKSDPPDLLIEVDVTSDSRRRFPIFAAIGVPEVWRLDGDTIDFHQLRDGEYSIVEASQWFPFLTAVKAEAFFAAYWELDQQSWLDSIRDFVRSSR